MESLPEGAYGHCPARIEGLSYEEIAKIMDCPIGWCAPAFSGLGRRSLHVSSRCSTFLGQALVAAVMSETRAVVTALDKRVRPGEDRFRRMRSLPRAGGCGGPASARCYAATSASGVS